MQLVRVYANSVLTQDFGHDLLANYFKGPNSRRQRIDAYYNLASSALDLVEDDRALNEAIRIGLYDTDILPKKPYLMEHSSFMELPYGEDERTFQKLLIAQRTIGVLTYIATRTVREALQRKTEFEIKDEEINKLKEKRSDEIISRIGRDEVARLKNTMVDFATIVGGRPQSDSDVKLLKDVWPYNILYDEDEPQNKKLQDVAMEKVTSESLKPYRADYLKNKGVEDVVFFSITSPRGFIIDISMSRHLLVEKKTVVQYALSSALIEQEGGTFIESPLPLLGSYTTELDGEVENSPILLSLRRPSGFERNQHPLQSLETIGFPNPRLEDGQETSAANQELADEIRRNQVRFLNRRGVRIPVKNTPLGDFGYSHIDFQKDPDDLSKTVVKIFVGDVPYSVKLDQYYSFDFEGKKFNAPFIQDALRYTILSYLKPILCDATIKNAKGEEKDLETEVISRMGHLMLLPSDRHRSVQAIVNCFRIEGKDLIALDAERREMRRKAGNRVPEDREYTYRRPVIEKDENLPPITINLPGILKFRNS